MQKDEGIVSVLPKIIKTAFSLVHLIYFFTAGPDEVSRHAVSGGAWWARYVADEAGCKLP